MPPVVSVVVPTLNSRRTIQPCLDSVRAQTLKSPEIIVVDSHSDDGTADVAREYGRVILADTGLTMARLLGVEEATGDYVLNLDSDQTLIPNAIESALSTRKAVVAMGEVSEGSGLVARINRLDKNTVNRFWARNMDPISGFIRPRFYRRDLLLQALRSIPNNILNVRPCPFSEDSLIFIQAGAKPEDVGFVPDAVVHSEETRLLAYLRKWRVYGQTAKAYRGTRFEGLISSRGKRNIPGIPRLATLPGLLLRVTPFVFGYYI